MEKDTAKDSVALRKYNYFNFYFIFDLVNLTRVNWYARFINKENTAMYVIYELTEFEDNG